MERLLNVRVDGVDCDPVQWGSMVTLEEVIECLSEHADQDQGGRGPYPDGTRFSLTDPHTGVTTEFVLLGVYPAQTVLPV